MPELPEVEITARRLSEALAGEEVRSALAPGINALKTFDPPLHALEGRTVEAIRRIGKHLVIDLDGDLHVLLHLMSAGRLQLYPKRAACATGPRGCCCASTATASCACASSGPARPRGSRSSAATRSSTTTR
jgi:formamidopyrimidine-DNA glycosylase